MTSKRSGHSWMMIDHVTSHSPRTQRFTNPKPVHISTPSLSLFTQIRVRGQVDRESVSPVEEEEENKDPWLFLTSRDSSVLTPDSKVNLQIYYNKAVSQEHGYICTC